MLTLGAATLRQKLIQALGQRPNVRARTLSGLVRTDSGGAYTVQAIHKELRQLVRDGIVVRCAMTYQLDSSWLAEVSQFVESARRKLRENTVWPAAGRTVRRTFTDPAYLLQWLTDAVLDLISLTKARGVFEFCPSLWQGLVNLPNEQRFWRRIDQLEVAYRIVVGTSSRLDRAYCRLFPRPESLLLGYHLDGFNRFAQIIALPPYLIEVHLSPGHLRLVRRMFGSKQLSSIDLLNQGAEFRRNRGRIRVKVTNTPTAATKVWRAFEEFGLSGCRKDK